MKKIIIIVLVCALIVGVLQFFSLKEHDEKIYSEGYWKGYIQGKKDTNQNYFDSEFPNFPFVELFWDTPNYCYEN